MGMIDPHGNIDHGEDHTPRCYICGKELPRDHNERVRGWFPEPHECHRECLSDLCAAANSALLGTFPVLSGFMHVARTVSSNASGSMLYRVAMSIRKEEAEDIERDR